MTTGATGQLGLALPVQGELSGTWGDTVNNGITQYTNIAIAATLTLTNDGAVTLANTTGDASASNITSTLTGAGTVTAQFAIVRVTGTLTTAKVVTAPSYSKTYTVVNAATGGIVTFKAAGQTGVSIAVGESAFVYFNGTDYVKVSSTVATGVTSFTAGTTGLTPNTATTGAVTLAGTLATANGGTNLGGATPFTSGGVVYASSTSALATGSALTYNGTSFGVGSSDYGNAGTINLSVGVPATTSGGLQLWATTTQTHVIQWGDGTTGTDPYRGYIEYAHNGDTMRFGVTSTENMRLTTSGSGNGNLLIGTTSSTFSAGGRGVIEVAGSGTALVSLKGGSALSYIFNDGGNLNIQNNSAGTFQLSNNSAVSFQIGSAGQWGIGGATYGTAGQVFTSGGSGAAPTWTAPSSGALVYISQVVANNSATVSFTGLTAYDNYMVVLSKVIPAGSSVNLYMRTSVNNGSSYASTSYLYSIVYVLSSNGTIGSRHSATTSPTTDQFRLSANNMDVGSGYPCRISGSYTLNVKDASSNNFNIYGVGSMIDEGGNSTNPVVGGTRTETSATNAIQFFFSSGNITSGTFRLYGIANS